MDLIRATLGRLFHIHPEDWKPLLLLQALIVSICTIIAATKTIANSLFVGHVGVESLPYLYMACAITLGLSGFFLIPLIDKFPRLTIYRITTISLAALFGLSFLAMQADHTWVYYLAYVLASLTDTLLFLEFWLIAGDLCDSRQAKRVFPLVIGWSLIGGIVGSFGTKFLVTFLSTQFLILVCICLLLATLGLIGLIQKAFPRETNQSTAPKIDFTIGRWPRLKLDFRIVHESALVRLICGSLVLYSILAFLIDFLFNVVAAQSFTVHGKIQVDRLTGFYGMFDGISITVALLFQFFLVHRVLRVIGITNAQLILPGMFTVGFSAIFSGYVLGGTRTAFGPTLGTRMGQKFLSSSIHRSSQTMLYSPIASEKRGRSRAFAESIVQPLGVFMAGALIMGIRQRPLSQIGAIAIGCSIAYLLLMLRLRKVYLQQILKMFEDKNFGALESFAGMFARLGEKEIMDKLCDCLADKDFNIRNFVVELLGEIKSKAGIEPLIELYRSEDNPTVKATAISVLGQLGTSKIASVLREAMGNQDARIRANAIEAIVASKNVELYDLIRQSLNDRDARVMANASLAIWRLKIPSEASRAQGILLERYEKGALKDKLSCLYAFGQIGTGPYLEALIDATRQADPKILARAIHSLGHTRSEKATQTLVDLLPMVNSAMQNAITSALGELAPHCPDMILKSLHHPDIYSRKHLIRVAAMLDDKRTPTILKDVALAEIESVHRHREWEDKVRKIPQGEVQGLFLDTFEKLIAQAKENVMEIVRILAGNTPAIQGIIKDLSHPNRFVRASALDALEAVGDKTIAKAFVPILESRVAMQGPANTAAEASGEEILAWVRQWLKSPYRWIRACGTFTVGRLRLGQLHGELLSALSDSYDLVRANAIEALTQFGIESNRVYLERMLKDPSPLPRRYAKELLG